MTIALAAQALTVGYKGGAALVRGWSHEFHSGEVVAVTGESGRGKSTLLYVLGLMLRPQEGEVTVAGIRADNLSDSRRAALRATQFGFVFQDASLDSTRSVLDNVLETALYRNADRQREHRRAQFLLDRFGVSDRASAKPGQVSGGQAQRIALCRALLHNPPILLADEPTGNLDHQSAEVVAAAFRDHAREGGCVLIVTHDSRLASMCDRQIEL